MNGRPKTAQVFVCRIIISTLEYYCWLQTSSADLTMSMTILNDFKNADFTLFAHVIANLIQRSYEPSLGCFYIWEYYCWEGHRSSNANLEVFISTLHLLSISFKFISFYCLWNVSLVIRNLVLPSATKTQLKKQRNKFSILMAAV